MPNPIVGLGVVMGMCHNVHAVEMTLNSCWNSTTQTYSLPCLNSGVMPNSNCQMVCQMHSGAASTTSTNNGVLTITSKSIKVVCGDNADSSDNVTCSVNHSTEYRCATGYYGTATSSSAGCTACPANATCVGGNNSTFVCNAGYIKNSSSCGACMAGNYCPGDNSMYSCKTNTNNTDATSAAKSDAITDCYVPASASWLFSDTVGSGTEQFSSNCYYSS